MDQFIWDLMPVSLLLFYYPWRILHWTWIGIYTNLSNTNLSKNWLKETKRYLLTIIINLLRITRPCALITLLTYEYVWIELIEDHSLQVYAVNNFGIGSPGDKTFQIPKGLLTNTSLHFAANITKVPWLFKVIISQLFYVGALDMKR